MDSDRVYTNGTNGHSTAVDDEHPQPIASTTTTDKQSTDAVCQ